MHLVLSLNHRYRSRATSRSSPWVRRSPACLRSSAAFWLASTGAVRARCCGSSQVPVPSTRRMASRAICSIPRRILLRDKTAYGANVTGTFINRNTAAVYFGSCAIVCLMLLSDRLRRKLPSGPIAWKKLPNQLLSDTPRDIAALGVMLFVCLAAMFMTGSRAGVVLSLMSLVIAFTLYFRRDLPRRSGIIAAVLGAGAVALVLLQFLGGEVNARFDAQGAADEGRLATWRATLRMVADHPWFGTGQGTFAWSFPAYRSDEVSMQGIWDRAHNTLLKLAADMGAPLAVAVTLGWLVIFGVLIHGSWVRRRDLLIPGAALSVAILANLHSLVDFSLQIPGYAIPALALVGAGLAQSFSSAERRAAGGPGGANRVFTFVFTFGGRSAVFQATVICEVI